MEEPKMPYLQDALFVGFSLLFLIFLGARDYLAVFGSY